MIIGLAIMNYSISMFFVLLGYKFHGRAPIESQDQVITNMVDPLPQALVLTSIVIALAVMALLIAVAIRIYERYGTFDITKIKKLKG